MEKFHVLMDRGKWVILRGNDERPLSLYRTQAEANAAATAMARRHRGELTFYDEHGKVRDWVSYSDELSAPRFLG
ncbi:MAG: DUF2188 domain-containing protein [Thermoanaerobaculia bacterium]